MSYRILIVDDETNFRLAVRRILEPRGYEVLEAGSCHETRRLLGTAPPDAAIIDYQLNDGTALDLLPDTQALVPPVPVVILTGFGSVDLAVRAIKEGAEQFLTKPVEIPTLMVMIERLMERRRKIQSALASQHSRPRGRDPFCGGSPPIRRLAEEASRVLHSESPILILGETGVGKGILARWLHEHGPRAEEPFVDLNCASLIPDFLDSELFGHQKGAFTGAAQRKAGLLEVAHHGTVFLDEIGDVDLEIQPKILKVLEEQRFRRLGDIKDRHVDIRLIAATHQDLPARVRDKQFRSDLYFRISTLPLRVPALRERPEDIPHLARQILNELAATLGRTGLELCEAAEAALQSYTWPGNIRELRNVLERAVLLSDTLVLRPSHFRFDDLGVAADSSAGDTLLEMERRHIERVLREEAGHVAKAAERLDIPISTLYKKLKRFGIDRRSFL